MADAEVVQDHYYNQNPTAFDQAQVEALKAKHGVLPTWANRRWRSEHRGWQGLKRVPAVMDDALTKDVLPCLKHPILDMEMQSQDGWIRHGDLVLCVQSLEDRERRDKKREYRANRKIRSLKKGQSELGEEISKASRGHISIDPQVTRLESEKKMVTNRAIRKQ